LASELTFNGSVSFFDRFAKPVELGGEMDLHRSTATTENFPGMEKVSLPDFFFLLQSELNRERFSFF